MYRVTKESMFSASHRLRNYNGKCERMHGHNWKVQATASGDTLDAGGMLIDFSLLKKALEEVLDALDHRDLNTVAPFDEIEPSAENIARHICEALGEKLDNERVFISEVNVWETDSSRATYLRERKHP